MKKETVKETGNLVKHIDAVFEKIKQFTTKTNKQTNKHKTTTN